MYELKHFTNLTGTGTGEDVNGRKEGEDLDGGDRRCVG